MFHRVIASVRSSTVSNRRYASSFEDRLASRASQATAPQQGSRYADRERGDLSEFAQTIHGLSNATGGRELEVLRAWERGDFTTVLDTCDDVIEAEAWEFERSSENSSSRSTPLSGQEQNTAGAKQEMFIFHRNVKAAALNRLGKWTDAIAVAEETIRLTNRRDRDALCLKATALNALGSIENNRARDEEALRLFMEAANLASSGDHDLEVSLNQATLCFKLGRANEALQICQDALNFDTIVPSPFSDDDDPFAEKPAALQSALSKLADDARAVEAAGEQSSKAPAVPKRSLSNEFDPDLDAPDPIAYRQAGLDREHIKYDPELRLLLAIILASLKRPADSLAQCKLGITAVKRKGALGSRVLTKLLDTQYKMFLALNRLPEAELVTRMLVKMHPDDLDRLDPYIQIKMRLNKPYEETLAVAKDYLPQYSLDVKNYPRVLKILLAVHHYYDKLEEADKICDELIKLKTDFDVAYPMKAMVLLRLKREAEAVEVVTRAEELGLLTPDILITKALAYEGMNDNDNAIFEFERIISKFPHFAPAHFRYANTLARLGRNEEALKGYDRAIQTGTQTGNNVSKIVLAKANLLRSIGRLQDAIRAYTDLARHDPEVAKQLPALLQQFKAGNPAEFVSDETKMRAESARNAAAKLGIDFSNQGGNQSL